MQVRVLVFGAEALAVGSAAVEVEVPEGATIREFRGAVAEQHPALGAAMARVRVARNHAFAGPDEVVGAGDELAIIGLVSGG